MAELLKLQPHTPIVSGWWVTGLVDGEGCFYAGLIFRSKSSPTTGKSYSCVNLQAELDVALRADDKATLDKLHQFFGCGVVVKKTVSASALSRVKQGQKNPRNQFLFRVRDPKDLMTTVIPHFQKFPLQSKKARDFEIWTQIVRFAYTELLGHKQWLRRFPDKVSKMGSMCDDLRQVRAFPEELEVTNV